MRGAVFSCLHFFPQAASEREEFYGNLSALPVEKCRVECLSPSVKETESASVHNALQGLYMECVWVGEKEGGGSGLTP